MFSAAFFALFSWARTRITQPVPESCSDFRKREYPPTDNNNPPSLRCKESMVESGEATADRKYVYNLSDSG